MSNIVKLGCVMTRRTSKIKCDWIFRNVVGSGNLLSVSPTFTDDGFHRISWRLELTRHPSIEYTPLYSSQHDTYLTLIPTSGNIRPDLNVKCIVSILGRDGSVVSGPHKLNRCDPQVPTYRSPHYVLSEENLRVNQHLWLPDGHLKVRCQVEVSDCVAQTNGDDQVDSCWSQDFDRLFDNRVPFSDVILTAGGRHFPAHKVILATRSPVFAAMFQPNTKESQTNVVDIVGIDPDVLHQMLRFVYTNRADVALDVAESLLAAADMYQLDQLKTICERKLLQQLSADNAVQLFVVADRYSANDLKDKVKMFINSSPPVVATEDWKTLALHHPHLLADLYSSLVAHSGIADSSQYSFKCTQTQTVERFSSKP